MTPSDAFDRPPGAEALGLIERYRAAIVDELRAVLAERTAPPYPQMRYHLGWEDRQGRPIEGRGGKLLRPGLCLLCCEAVGGEWRRALPAAAALELLHNFTLIHDDVEDESLQRHGRDTVWSVWDRSQAINAGDGMFALANATLLRLQGHGHPPETILRAVQLMGEATLRLCEGQHRDLINAGREETTIDDYLEMIEGKTATLLAASTAIGALVGGGSEETVAALWEFGRRLGFAFQIQDDVLGIWGDEGETGKPVDDDVRAGKRSHPIIVALERGSPDVRATLQQLLAQERRSDGDVARVASLLEEAGARVESERTARDHGEAAVASLAKVALLAPRSEELAGLARFAAERRS